MTRRQFDTRFERDDETGLLLPSGVCQRGVCDFLNVGPAFFGSSGGSFTGPMNSLGLSPIRAYSLRKLFTAYAGSSIRIRRSNDSAEQDIGFDASGNLDTVAIASFVGSNSAYVKTFYDQSGNAANITNSTAGAQPRIVNAGTLDLLNTGVPTMVFDGTDDVLYNDSLTLTQAFTRCGVLKFNSVASGKNPYSDGVDNSLNFSAAGSLATYAGSNATFKTGVAEGDTATVIEAINGSSSAWNYNGAESTGNPSTTAYNVIVIGAARNPGVSTSTYTNVSCSEHLLFNTQLNSTNRAALAANQKAYWGTP